MPSALRTALQYLLNPFAWLRTGDEHATSDRLAVSQHVKDLRLILAVAMAGVLLVLVFGLALSAENEFANQTAAVAGKAADWGSRHPMHRVFKTAGGFLTFFGPTLAAFGTLLAWAYQVGSARLGVVDLFACEISTLCRVAIVVDAIGRQLGMFEAGPPKGPADPAGAHAAARPFTTQENYFPVFETNSHDLETLEAKVVINITAFYTYLKAFRDSQRTLAATTAAPPAAPSAKPMGAKPANDPWQDTVSNAIYLLFLTLESARLAVGQLVEFNPERTERTIVILISELPAYGFLRRRYRVGDFLRERIMLREAGYRDLKRALVAQVEEGLRQAHAALAKAQSDTDRDRANDLLQRWTAAHMLAPELQARFASAMKSGAS